ncbi:hypothetical protein EJB05_20905, partial [Eragrostis curvula]
MHCHGDDSREEDQVLRLAAQCFTEVALRDYGCLKLKPSAVAAAAIFLARLALNPSYGQAMRYFTTDTSAAQIPICIFGMKPKVFIAMKKNSSQ